MITFSKEVTRQSTLILPLDLGCTDDQNKRIVASRVHQLEDLELEKQKQEKSHQVLGQIGDGKCEVTSIAIGKGDAAFDIGEGDVAFDIGEGDAAFDIGEGDVAFDSVGNCNPPKLESKNFNEPSLVKDRDFTHNFIG